MIKYIIRLFFLTFILGALTAGQAAWALSLDDAIRNYQDGNFKKAEKDWQNLAEAGDANALFNLGQMYHLGKGATFDDKKAADYFLAAANMGHTAAARELGNLYFFSPGVNGGKEAAVKWWNKAAEAGDGKAQYILGIIYFNGDGVDQDLVLGFAWTLLAVDVGIMEAIQSQTAMRGQLTDQQFTDSQLLAGVLMTGMPRQAKANLLVGEVPTKAHTFRPPTKTAEVDLPTVEEPEVQIENTAVLEIEQTPPQEENKEEVQTEPEPKPLPDPIIEVQTTPVADPALAEDKPPQNEDPRDEFTETRQALNGLIDETTPAEKEPVSEDDYDLGDPLSPLVTEENFSPDWSVQLTSFRKPENAETHWQSAFGANSELFAGLEKRIIRYDLGPDMGIYYRLRIGPFSDKATADQKCLDLQDAGLDCLVIWP